MRIAQAVHRAPATKTVSTPAQKVQTGSRPVGTDSGEDRLETGPRPIATVDRPGRRLIHGAKYRIKTCPVRSKSAARRLATQQNRPQRPRVRAKLFESGPGPDRCRTATPNCRARLVRNRTPGQRVSFRENVDAKQHTLSTPAQHPPGLIEAGLTRLNPSCRMVHTCQHRPGTGPGCRKTGQNLTIVCQIHCSTCRSGSIISLSVPKFGPRFTYMGIDAVLRVCNSV